MSRKISQAKAKVILVSTVVVALVATVHLWNGPTESMGMYLTIFALLYVTLTCILLWLLGILKGNLKVVALFTALFTLAVAGYDVFGIALGAMQF